MDRNYDVINFVSKYLKVANFADIIKFSTIIIKATLTDSKKVKRIKIMY